MTCRHIDCDCPTRLELQRESQYDMPDDGCEDCERNGSSICETCWPFWVRERQALIQWLRDNPDAFGVGTEPSPEEIRQRAIDTEDDRRCEPWD